jgi:hypothetical protein
VNTVTWMTTVYSYVKLHPNRIFIKRVCPEHPIINQSEGNGKETPNFEFEKSRKNKNILLIYQKYLLPSVGL